MLTGTKSDITQQRAGYTTETELNVLRREYIDRARGLPISVFFNTTVHAANFDDVPMLAAFFVAQADVVRFASFQLQAETGRGVLGARVDTIGNDSVAQRLQQGAGVALKFNVLAAFFVAQADVVRFASFQLQAETGRGVLGARLDVISNDSIAQQIGRAHV